MKSGEITIIPKPELRGTHLESLRHSPCPSAKRAPVLSGVKRHLEESSNTVQIADWIPQTDTAVREFDLLEKPNGLGAASTSGRGTLRGCKAKTALSWKYCTGGPSSDSGCARMKSLAICFAQAKAMPFSSPFKIGVFVRFCQSTRVDPVSMGTWLLPTSQMQNLTVWVLSSVSGGLSLGASFGSSFCLPSSVFFTACCPFSLSMLTSLLAASSRRWCFVKWSMSSSSGWPFLLMVGVASVLGSRSLPLSFLPFHLRWPRLSRYHVTRWNDLTAKDRTVAPFFWNLLPPSLLTWLAGKPTSQMKMYLP